MVEPCARRPAPAAGRATSAVRLSPRPGAGGCRRPGRWPARRSTSSGSSRARGRRPCRPGRRCATEPTPSTIVQKMTGWIIILIRATKPVPSGLSSTAKSGATRPTAMPSDHGDDHGEVEVVGAVLLRPVPRSPVAWCVIGPPRSGRGGRRLDRMSRRAACDPASPLCSLSSRRRSVRAASRHDRGDMRRCARGSRTSVARQVLAAAGARRAGRRRRRHGLACVRRPARRRATPRRSRARSSLGGGRLPRRRRDALATADPSRHPAAVRRAGPQATPASTSWS